MNPKLIKSFFEKIEKTKSCWNWKAYISPNGYGRINYYDGKRVKVFMAHRVSYEIHKGSIPKGLVIDHLCRNRACVNPDHLEAVDLKTNIFRGVGASAQNVKKTHCPKGHPYNYINPKNKERRCTICEYKHKKAWADRNSERERERKRNYWHKRGKFLDNNK